MFFLRKKKRHLGEKNPHEGHDNFAHESVAVDYW